MRPSILIALAGLGLSSPAWAAPFGPGEQMVLSVDYAGIHAGTTRVTVGAATKLGTRSVWPIVTLADTESLFALFPLHDKFVSWWDPEAGRGVAYDFYANEGGKLRRERCKLNSPEPGKAQIQRVKEGEAPSLAAVEVEPDSQDILAAFFALRSMKLEPGSDVSVKVFTGFHTWAMTAHVGPPEWLEVPAGRFEALPLEVSVHFQGKLETKRKIQVWLSNDAHHALLRVQAELALGSVTGKLVEYHPGNDAAATLP